MHVVSWDQGVGWGYVGRIGGDVPVWLSWLGGRIRLIQEDPTPQNVTCIDELVITSKLEIMAALPSTSSRLTICGLFDTGLREDFRIGFDYRTKGVGIIIMTSVRQHSLVRQTMSVLL